MEHNKEDDITRNITSPLRLFADDRLLYRVIESHSDTTILQQDLDKLSEWVRIWQLRFNVSKCVVIRCTRSQSPIIHNYKLNHHTLTITDRHTYLGVVLDNHLSWSPHISKITGKGSRTLNFLKRNLSNCSTEVKAASYLAMVRPQLEYASVVLDPIYNNDIHKLENIQRRAARWVLKDYNRYSSVTSMLKHLSWPELQTRRKIARLQTFYKALHNDIPISLPANYFPMNRETRQYHQHHFILPLTSTTAYQKSFFSRTVQEWNYLPQSYIDLDYDSFSINVSNYYNVLV